MQYNYSFLFTPHFTKKATPLQSNQHSFQTSPTAAPKSPPLVPFSPAQSSKAALGLSRDKPRALPEAPLREFRGCAPRWPLGPPSLCSGPPSRILLTLAICFMAYSYRNTPKDQRNIPQ